MAVKTEWTLKKWHLYLAILTLAVTVISSLAGMLQGYTTNNANLRSTVEAHGASISSNANRIYSLEQARTLDHNVLLELKINMKHQMKAQGLEYQEVTP